MSVAAFVFHSHATIIIIINRISRVPIYHTRWEHRALYNSTHNTHARTHRRTHTHTRVGQGARHGCEKTSLEIVIKQWCILRAALKEELGRDICAYFRSCVRVEVAILGCPS